MTNNQIASMLMILLGIMVVVLVVLVCVFILIRFKSKKKDDKKDEKVSDKTRVQQLYSIQSIFNFMEFDKIEDNMIVQKKGKRFIMIIKCQGINFDLMSGVEKNSVEQGFIQYLNTLRFPIQIYIQTRTVDLTGSINTYKEKIKNIGDDLAKKEFEYNQKVRSGQYDKYELDGDKFEITKARNLYEYGTDIVNNTERMSLNKNILTKHYYVVLSYYPEEASSDIYGQEEINNMAFSELYTRAQSTISLLSVCGVNGKILDSVELAELLYSAYNRDEAEVYDLKRAINSGYDSLYTTSQDVFEKRINELDKQIEIDAIQKANKAVLDARQESDIERKARQKEVNYKDLVEKMAALILDNNKEVLGEEITEKAKEKINTKNSKKINNQDKEEKVNEQEKVKRAGRPRKKSA